MTKLCGSIRIIRLKKVLISIVILSALISSTQLQAAQSTTEGRSDKIIGWGKNSNSECNVPEPNTSFAALTDSNSECNVPEPNSDFATLAAGGDHNVGETNGVSQCNVPEPNLRDDVLEQRKNRLESQRTEPNLPADETIDALRTKRLSKKIQADEARDELIVKRLCKKIQEMKDAIELDEERIGNTPWLLDYPLKLEEKLQLLTDQEKNYKGIINLAERYRVPGVDVMDTQMIQAEKYRILGVDVMDMKNRLIECQGRKRRVELKIESLADKDRQQKIDSQRSRNEENQQQNIDSQRSRNMRRGR